MKEKVKIIEWEQTKVVLKRISVERFRELTPALSAELPFATILSFPGLNMAKFFWAMRSLFGDPGAMYRTSVMYEHTHHYSFPFKLEVRREGVLSTWTLHIDLYKSYFDVKVYRYAETEPDLRNDKRVTELRQRMEQEFPERERGYVVNFISGMCQGYIKTAPKPKFFWRAEKYLMTVFGCRDGHFFEIDYGEAPLDLLPELERKRDENGGLESDEDLEWRRREAGYNQKVAELRAIGPPFVVPNPKIKRDETLDYDGYGIAELSLIRRGEARCLLRLLHQRFGEEAALYEPLLLKADTYMLTCWSRSLLQAKTLDEVFILPNLDA